MADQRPTFRIFVSSPGDVQQERQLSARIIERLAAEFADRCCISGYFWEHEPMLATRDFQEQIPPPSSFEAVVCILWSRLGSRLHSNHARPDGSTYGSGTEYEFEDAALSALKRGSPELLVYACKREVAFPAKPKDERQQRIDQYDNLQGFLRKWFFEAAEERFKACFNTYQDLAGFEERLEAHLRGILLARFPRVSGVAERLPPSWKHGSPFRGLACFEFEHAPVFFGRTRAIDEILAGLRRQVADGRAFSLIFGSSGGGKSSLMRAGVIPLLTRPGVLEGIGLWRRAVMRPTEAGGDLFAGLAGALTRPEALPELLSDGTTVARLGRMLCENPGGVAMLVKGGLSQAARDWAEAEHGARVATGGGRQGGAPDAGPRPGLQPKARLVIGIDQMEELFTLESITPDLREAFIQCLDVLARSGFVVVLATLRSEFFDRCAELPALMALKEGAGQFQLSSPTPAEIAQVIRLPAQAAGLRFEENAGGERLDDLLRDMAGRQNGVLPLLQFLLDQLYEHRSEDGTLTFEAYRTLGGLEGALRRRAEGVCEGLPVPVRATLPQVFRMLAVAEENGRGGFLRRRARMEDVAVGEAGTLVEALVTARLLTTDRDDQDGRPVVGVAHEALFEHWPAVREALEADRQRMLAFSRVERSSDRWVGAGRPDMLLLPSGRALNEAIELLRLPGFRLRPVVREFVLASHAAFREAFLARFRMGYILFASIAMFDSWGWPMNTPILGWFPHILFALGLGGIFVIDQDSGRYLRCFDRWFGRPLLYGLLAWFLISHLKGWYSALLVGNGETFGISFPLIITCMVVHNCSSTGRAGLAIWRMRQAGKGLFLHRLQALKIGLPVEKAGEFFEVAARREAGWPESPRDARAPVRTGLAFLRGLLIDPIVGVMLMAGILLLTICLLPIDEYQPNGAHWWSGGKGVKRGEAWILKARSDLLEWQEHLSGRFDSRESNARLVYRELQSTGQLTGTKDFNQSADSLDFCLDKLLEAVEHLESKAVHGDVDAMVVLARVLVNQPEDGIAEREARQRKAWRWLTIASELGNATATGLLASFASQLSAEVMPLATIELEETRATCRILRCRTASDTAVASGTPSGEGLAALAAMIERTIPFFNFPTRGIEQEFPGMFFGDSRTLYTRGLTILRQRALDDGRPAEAIRMARKNYFLAGSHEGRLANALMIKDLCDSAEERFLSRELVRAMLWETELEQRRLGKILGKWAVEAPLETLMHAELRLGILESDLAAGRKR